MTARRLLHRNQNGERGAVLIFAVVGIVVAILSAAMAIDVGSVIWRKRDLQVVADLAATDTAQQLTLVPGGPTQAAANQLAQESADRNGFTVTTPGYMSLVVELGDFDNTNGFVVTDPAAASAVRVEASREVPYNFVPGSNTVTTEAVATFTPTAVFSIGSELANVNANPPTALNRVLSTFLGTSSTMNLNLLSYKGLAAATVSLEEIAAADTSLGTPDQLPAGSVNVKQFAQATATALATKGAAGDTAAASAATILGSFAGTIKSTLNVGLGELIQVQQPGGAAAARAQFNVFDLLTGSAMAADGNNAITVSNLTLGIPGLTESTLNIKVVEKPQFAAGPARFDGNSGQWVTRARTAQLDIELVTKITVSSLAYVRLPIVVAGAQATGSLTSIRCANPVDSSDVDIRVDTFAGIATADARLRVLLGEVSLARAEVPLVGGSETLTFPGPHDGSDLRTTGATGLGLASLLAADLDLLGLINVGTFLGAVRPVTDAIDDLILGPVFDALGVSLANADVRTHAVDCAGTGARLAQ